MPEISCLIASRNEFHGAVRVAIAEAAAAGCREIWLSDADFADWPLGERAVIDSLVQWAQARRRLTLLAASFDVVVRRHARWVEWRRQWAHVVHCRTNTTLEPAQVPTILLAPGVVSVRLIDPQRHRGLISSDAHDGARCRGLIDASMQQSVEAFPVTTTGL